MGTATIIILGVGRQVVVVAVVAVSMCVQFPGKRLVGEKLASTWWFQPSPLSDRLAWTEPALDCPSDWVEKRG